MNHRLKRTLITVATVFTVIGVGASCTPAQQEHFKLLPKAEQVEVVKYIAAKNQATDCVGAMKQVWPANLHGWAEKIITRESRNTPTARNASGASGCFQMMLPLHNGRFSAVGCSPSEWSNAYCNVKAAWNLYQETGAQPWN